MSKETCQLPVLQPSVTDLSFSAHALPSSTHLIATSVALLDLVAPYNKVAPFMKLPQKDMQELALKQELAEFSQVFLSGNATNVVEVVKYPGIQHRFIKDNSGWYD